MRIVRILLDNCVVRNFVHASGAQLDLSAIGQRLWKYRISLADSASAELLRQMVEKRLPFRDWNARIHQFDVILDRKWPIFVGGKELAAIAGLQTDLTFEEHEYALYQQAYWQLLRNSRDEAQLLSGLTYKDGKGKARLLKPDPTMITSKLEQERLTWIDYVRQMKTFHDADPSAFSTVAGTKAIIASGLGTASTDPPDLREKLDGLVSVQAELLFTAFSARTPYNPASERRRGDLFDLSMLYALPLPSIIVTADGPFLQRLRRSKSTDSAQLVDVEEFNEHARNDTLETLVAHHETAVAQEERWRTAAYFRWVNRGAPSNDAWTDWFATEPIA